MRLLQFSQALAAVVRLEKSSAGNEVNALLYQALTKFVPLEVSICASVARDEQLYQVLLKLVPLEVSRSGNEVSEEQLYQL